MVVSRALLILRAFLLVSLGIFVVDAIPIYGWPFEGCESGGFWSWSRGCERHWPEFVRGFAFVLLVALAVPKNHWGGLFALTLVVGMGLLGGTYAMTLGLRPSSFRNAILYDMDRPLVFGGVVAFALYFVLYKWMSARSIMVRDA